MALTLQQTFLTGRFHATRWNQSPFEDLHGEWPPSPYRLLRALAARWFQYARETGDRDTVLRDALLRALANQAPAFHLPENATHSAAWASRGIKQYLPTELVKSDKAAGEPWMLRAQTTLFVDTFATLPATHAVFWLWPDLALAPERIALLDALLARITYFGRAESLCLMRRITDGRTPKTHNCALSADGSGCPVLVSDPETPLNVEILLAHNDDGRLRGRRIPPGTRWLFAQRPPKPMHRSFSKPVVRPRPPVQTLQFAVGGRVFPPRKSWIEFTEKFRGRVLAQLRSLLFGKKFARGLTPEQLDTISLMTGKRGDGTPLRDHGHIYFWLLPDEDGCPTRLVCHRNTPFSGIEQEALLRASEDAIAWQFGNLDWMLRTVPLPTETPLPANNDLLATAIGWESATPYIPPRHTISRNGKPKTGDSVEEQIVRDLQEHHGMPKPVEVRVTDNEWVKAHEPKRGVRGQSNRDKRGYKIALQFAEPVRGPIALGSSCHFGLGLFVPSS